MISRLVACAVAAFGLAASAAANGRTLKAVHAVSPKTRLGLCMPGWFPEDDTATFARALAGPEHRPLVRCAGAFYGHSKSVELPGRMFVAQADWKAPIPYPEFAPWARTLACMGLPYTTHEAPVRLFATQWAFDDYDGAAITNLLAGRVVLDGAAAETLTARGFAPLMGVSAVLRDMVDFTGEMSVGSDGQARSFTCSYHTNYGLDGTPVSRLTLSALAQVYKTVVLRIQNVGS